MKLRLVLLLAVFALLVPISAAARPAEPRGPGRAVPNIPAFDLDPSPTPAVTTSPGATFTLTYQIQNTSTNNETEDYDIQIVNTPTNPVLWNITQSPDPITVVRPFEIRSFIVTVNVPTGTPLGSYAFGVRVTSIPGGIVHTSDVIVNVAQATPTPTVTPSPTPTGTPTATGSPTGTPPTICAGGTGTRNDGFEPDNELLRARRIEIDITQRHALCPTGDEDWLFFGGLEGKVYSIDVTEAVPGLDPSLTLYDENGNQLAFNDDYYERSEGATDIKPRIDSWRAPRNGQYYIKVRDAAGRGFNNAFYSIILESESYGPTPTQVAEICEDLYEPDGLPEEATLMVVNEVHPEKHKLCPRGDADWVKFFAKSGKTYSIFTSDLTVGADTVLVLADRDGTSIIDFNDDFGTSLASRIDFSAPVDGFYYAQVKNVGDVGNQFIDYKLSFMLTENANGGGGGVTPTEPSGSTPTRATPTATFGTTTPGSPTPTTTGTTTPGTTTPGTATVTPGGTATAYPRPAGSQKLPPIKNATSGEFVDPAFEQVWRRADEPVAAGAATRTWLWGPDSGRARAEVYGQSAGGLRQVQYFDKSRMEITDFDASRSATWYVTNGLLAKEMIQGRIQVGDDSYIQQQPAQIPLAGDLDDSRGPTYASLRTVLAPAGDRTGQYATATLSRAGKVGAYGGPQREGARLVHFVPETGHTVAGAFWDFMNRRGPIKENGAVRDGLIMDWVFTLGYPISEPYWTTVRVGGAEHDVLVQAFERRVLTYTPDNPAAWQVEMGNVGQHYYLWRYGELPR